MIFDWIICIGVLVLVLPDL